MQTCLLGSWICFACSKTLVNGFDSFFISFMLVYFKVYEKIEKQYLWNTKKEMSHGGPVQEQQIQITTINHSFYQRSVGKKVHQDDECERQELFFVLLFVRSPLWMNWVCCNWHDFGEFWIEAFQFCFRCLLDRLFYLSFILSYFNFVACTRVDRTKI